MGLATASRNPADKAPQPASASDGGGHPLRSCTQIRDEVHGNVCTRLRGRAQRVLADLGFDAGRPGPPLNHPVGVRLRHAVRLAGESPRGAEHGPSLSPAMPVTSNVLRSAVEMEPKPTLRWTFSTCSLNWPASVTGASSGVQGLAPCGTGRRKNLVAIGAFEDRPVRLKYDWSR